MSRKVLGIDIQNDAVSAVLVRSSLREKRIENHAFMPIRDAEDEAGGLTAALNTIADSMDLSGCDCAVSISADLFSFRNMQVPFKDAKKIRMMLPFELEPTLPYQIEDITIDFRVLQTDDQKERTSLFAAMVEKTDLDAHLETLALLKINPEIVTISGLPTALCLASQADPGEDQLLLAFNKNHSVLFANVAGQISLIRSFPMPPAASSNHQSIGNQVLRTLAAFEEIAHSDFQPLEVIVTGNGLDGLNLKEEVAKVLKLPVKFANFADRFDLPIETSDENFWNPARMDNALALALMEIDGLNGLNFHKGRFAAKKFFVKNKSNLVKTGILAAVVLALLFFNVITESYTLRKRVAHLDQQITGILKATFPGVKAKGDPYSLMQVKIKEAKQNKVFQVESINSIRSIDILNHISLSIPKNTIVDITRMVIGPENVLISGNTDTFNAVDDMKSRLEQIDSFKKVTISSANTDRSGKEIRFQLKVEL